MLARLQRGSMIGLIAATLLWVMFFSQRGQWAWAALAIPALLLGHAFVLGIEVLLMPTLNRHDPAPPSTAQQRLHAWWAEACLTPPVFWWRQPFRSHRYPDRIPAASESASGRAGVVLVHGFVCNRGFWNPWMERLRAEDIAYVAVDLEPVFGPIDGYTPIIEEAVKRLTTATGHAPMIVAHSMGGLAVRSWLAQDPAACNGQARVQRVITLASPHRGTWLARFSVARNAAQLRLSSAWLSALAARETAAHRALFTCYYSHCDNLVLPASSATLPGADNRHVPGRAHVELAFDAALMEEVFAELRTPAASAAPLSHPARAAAPMSAPRPC